MLGFPLLDRLEQPLEDENSNLFWYFKNPGGGLAEYFSDMDVIDDEWKAPIWDTNPGFSLWMA
jgi:hypothetical protein